MAISASAIVVTLLVGLLLGLFVFWVLRRGQERAVFVRAAEQERLLAELRTENMRIGNDLARAQEQASLLPEMRRQLDAQTQAVRDLQTHIATLSQTIGGLESSVESQQRRNRELDIELVQLKTGREDLLRERQAAELARAEANTNLENERSQSIQKLAILNDAREQLSAQFKALAGEILEEKSRKFTEQNQTNLGNLLVPLRERLNEFQAKVEEAQKEGIGGRSELREQIAQLKSLNERLSQDATNLVTALKGSSKKQGDWGEFILQGLLDAAGLRQGHEYSVQKSMKAEDGRGSRLDVVINLPGGRHLVIDSKVSLLDYAEYCNLDEEEAREGALARHLLSVRTHLKGLSERNYQSLYELRSLDFVVMFVPIEPAFMLAIARDPALWNDGWNKNVLMVSPSTLLFVIRTVAHLWKQEQQTQNVKDIVKRGSALYDKFVGFVDDLNAIGQRLAQAKDSYDEAYGKLSTGSGSLVRQVELLRALGVKPKSKTLAAELVAPEIDFGEGAIEIEGADDDRISAETNGSRS